MIQPISPTALVSAGSGGSQRLHTFQSTGVYSDTDAADLSHPFHSEPHPVNSHWMSNSPRASGVPMRERPHQSSLALTSVTFQRILRITGMEKLIKRTYGPHDSAVVKFEKSVSVACGFTLVFSAIPVIALHLLGSALSLHILGFFFIGCALATLIGLIVSFLTKDHSFLRLVGMLITALLPWVMEIGFGCRAIEHFGTAIFTWSLAGWSASILTGGSIKTTSLIIFLPTLIAAILFPILEQFDVLMEYANAVGTPTHSFQFWFVFISAVLPLATTWWIFVIFIRRNEHALDMVMSLAERIVKMDVDSDCLVAVDSFVSEGGCMLSFALKDVAHKIHHYQQKTNDVVKAEKEANEMKSLFLANMSHEIRTPAAQIVSTVELLSHFLADFPLTSEHKECLSNLKMSSTSLLVLLNSILDYCKLGAGTLLMEKQPVDIFQLVSDVCKTAYENGDQGAKAKGIDLACIADPAAGCVVIGDNLRYRQLLMQLLSNAVKFTNEGGSIILMVDLIPRDTINELSPRAAIRFRISDNGVGMNEDVLTTLFMSFHQGDRARNRKEQGMGLGLALCQRLVSAMTGSITATSVEGEGTVVTVTIPVQMNAPVGGLVASRMASLGSFYDRRPDSPSMSMRESAQLLPYVVPKSNNTGALQPTSSNHSTATPRLRKCAVLCLKSPFLVYVFRAYFALYDWHVIIVSSVEELARAGQPKPGGSGEVHLGFPPSQAIVKIAREAAIEPCPVHEKHLRLFGDSVARPFSKKSCSGDFVENVSLVVTDETAEIVDTHLGPLIQLPSVVLVNPIGAGNLLNRLLFALPIVPQRFQEIVRGSPSFAIKTGAAAGSPFSSVKRSGSRLMMAAPAVIQSSPASSQYATPDAISQTPPFAVLVVDDSPINRKVLVRILEVQWAAKGFTRKLICETAEDGQFALEAYRKRNVQRTDPPPFSLVLMDVAMPKTAMALALVFFQEVLVVPKMETEKFFQIRKMEQDLTLSHVYIAAVTAHALEEDRVMCLASGMDNYLTKPVNAPQLVELVSLLCAIPMLYINGALFLLFSLASVCSGDQAILRRSAAGVQKGMQPLNAQSHIFRRQNRPTCVIGNIIF